MITPAEFSNRVHAKANTLSSRWVRENHPEIHKSNVEAAKAEMTERFGTPVKKADQLKSLAEENEMLRAALEAKGIEVS